MTVTVTVTVRAPYGSDKEKFAHMLRGLSCLSLCGMLLALAGFERRGGFGTSVWPPLGVSHRCIVPGGCSISKCWTRGTNRQGLLQLQVQLASEFLCQTQISDQMWTLWPQLIQCFHEWAIDYFENILVPLDNFISRGTDTFLSGRNPNYLQQARLPRPCPALTPTASLFKCCMQPLNNSR